jgi:hypothetical protein
MISMDDIRPMNGAELQMAGEILFGPKWKSRLALKLRIGRTTLWRYAQAETVPPRAAMAVRELLAKKVGR